MMAEGSLSSGSIPAAILWFSQSRFELDFNVTYWQRTESAVRIFTYAPRILTYLYKSLKRTSTQKLRTISPNPSKLGVQLVHGIDTDPAGVFLALGVPVSQS